MMRPMRLGKREITEIEELKEVLETCKVLRLGMTDKEGMFIVPVNFGYELEEENKELKLYIHSAGEGRKAEALAENSEVAFEMDCCHKLIQGDYTCSYSYAYKSIMGTGKACRLEGVEEKIHGLQVLMHHLEPGSDIKFQDGMLDRVAVYRIDVTEFTGKKRLPK